MSDEKDDAQFTELAGQVLQKDIQPMFSSLPNIKEDITQPSKDLMPRADFDPTEIMVQVLRRPTDPMCRMLQNALYAWLDAGIGHMPTDDHFGGWIDVARNWQAYLFTQAKRFKYLLMVDSDIGPPIAAPYLLRRHDVPVVTGVACGWQVSKGGMFICVAVPGEDGKSRFVTLKNDNPIPTKGLIEVTNTGTGCLMVRRDVFEGLWAKYERELQDEKTAGLAINAILGAVKSGGKTELALTNEQVAALESTARRLDWEHDTWGAPFSIPQSVRDKAFQIGKMPRGEDILFTDRVRRDLGLKMYCDLEVTCVHYKTMGLMWPLDARKDMTPGEWRPSLYSPEVER